MEKDLAEGKIGDAGSYDVEFKDGKLVAKVGLAKDAVPGVSVHGDLSVEVSARAVIEALKKAIPGVIDDAVLELAAKALGV